LPITALRGAVLMRRSKQILVTTLRGKPNNVRGCVHCAVCISNMDLVCIAEMWKRKQLNFCRSGSNLKEANSEAFDYLRIQKQSLSQTNTARGGETNFMWGQIFSIFFPSFDDNLLVRPITFVVKQNNTQSSVVILIIICLFLKKKTTKKLTQKLN